jgi:polyisoprenoid-binding protein YceI
MFRSLATATLILASTPLYAITYTLDSDHTEGVLRWSHLGFSNPTAQFSRVEGSVEFDSSDPTKSLVMVTIPLAAMSTGEPELDDDFRSADFFNVAKFATATFRSTKVEMLGNSDHLKVTGNLSLHGVTKAVTLDVTINKVATDPRNQLPTLGFDAAATLNRSDFGLGLYVPMVSDAIRIQITGQAAEAKGYAKWLQAKAAKATAKDAAATPRR